MTITKDENGGFRIQGKVKDNFTRITVNFPYNTDTIDAEIFLQELIQDIKKGSTINE